MKPGKDILSEYGPEGMDQASRPSGGGSPEVKDVHNYRPPVGPKGVMDGRSPGLHGSVMPCGTQRDN